MNDWDKTEQDAERGAYMASLAESYFWATHPKERPYLMDAIEVKRIIKDYENFGVSNTKSISTSEKVT